MCMALLNIVICDDVNEVSAVTIQACWTWAYFVEVFGILAAVVVNYAAKKAQQLRRAIHEERYLVGRQLNNLVPAASAVSSS